MIGVTEDNMAEEKPKDFKDTKEDRERRWKERFHDRREKIVLVVSFFVIIILLIFTIFFFYNAGNIVMAVLLMIITLIVSGIAIFAIDHVFYETE